MLRRRLLGPRSQAPSIGNGDIDISATANIAPNRAPVGTKKKGKGSKRSRKGNQANKKELQASLESAVFGTSVLDTERRHVIGDEQQEDHTSEINSLLEEPRFAERVTGDSDTELNEASQQAKQKPAWEDEDDQDEQIDITAKPRTKKLRKSEEESILDGAVYSRRLRAQFERINGQPRWATVSEEHKDGEMNDELENDQTGTDGAFLQKSSKRLASTSRLPKGMLDVTMVKDVNSAAPSRAVVQALKFHPHIACAMTAGLDKTLRLFQLDGKVNRQLQSVHFPDLPIYSASFTQGGNEIVLSGRRKFFYCYDLPSGTIRKVDQIQGRSEKSLEKMYANPESDKIVFTGRNGEIILVSNRTKQWAGTLKMNGAVNAVAFMEDPNKLLSSGRDGKVYLWDIRAQRCEHVFVDEGCISSTSLAVSRGDSYIACGSDTGVVNIYDSSCLTSAVPKPLKAVMNLTTSITHLDFHPSTQILGIGTRVVKDALRMVHLPSMTVFKNWPTGRTPLGYVNTFAFSPKGGYVSIGNDKGKALLYRLNHYSQL